MTAYPKQLDQRYAHAMRTLVQRVTRLETKTVAIDSGMPLALLPAVIDPAYSTGDPKAFINGSATLTGPYQHLASYTPVASDAVVVAPMPRTATSGGATYIILGKLT